ncbi:hypothetical protein LWC34_44030 [Kibdelosporangium philippinense]|uniref:Uncharacterized protein n=1 Tax=Kibdelosporangium philippinense TaxID=211113 RepID=A0ABS8ZR97_9PSEU|nr:hypothetical protein [Kibdelosporangium philippinense]MCE7009733.1 hypothetical protein [Kibdelosporangium philippinense]
MSKVDMDEADVGRDLMTTGLKSHHFFYRVHASVVDTVAQPWPVIQDVASRFCSDVPVAWHSVSTWQLRLDQANHLQGDFTRLGVAFSVVGSD